MRGIFGKMSLCKIPHFLQVLRSFSSKPFVSLCSDVWIPTALPMCARQMSRVVLPLSKEDIDLGSKTNVPDDFRKVYPEFLPDPSYKYRNKLKEMIEREEMLKRRKVIAIPEFYVGSILAVTISDPNAFGKTNRFVGICISRGGSGLRAHFCLRNIVDHIGVEIMYELYCPLILNIQVLRLEKRLDDDLTYLRDCLPEYSTFSFDMPPEPLPLDTPVPINPIKVKFKPMPWRSRWEFKELKGVEPYPLIHRLIAQREKQLKPWEKYDLMKEYRLTISEEEQAKIFRELAPHMPSLEASRRQLKKIKIKQQKF